MRRPNSPETDEKGRPIKHKTALERLVADLSAKFIGRPATDVGGRIEPARGLTAELAGAALGRALGFDRLIAQLSATFIDLPAIEIDHGDIGDLMPAMQMEFPVKDASLLNGIAVNDHIDFTVEANKGEMKVIAIKKK